MKKVHYNKEMTGIIIDENNTHFLIQFEKSKFCVAKNSIETKDIFDD